MGRFVEAIAHYPGRAAAAWVALSLIALTQLVDWKTGHLRLTVDASVDALIPADDPALRRYRDFRERFGEDEVLLVGLVFGDVFETQNLAALRAAARRIERLPYVDRVEALDRALHVDRRAGFLDVRGALDEIPADAASREALAAELLASPLHSGLVSRDRSTALLTVHFGPDAMPGDREVGEIAAIARAAAPGAALRLSGGVFGGIETSRALQADLARILPLAFLMLGFVGAAAMRSLQGALLPLLANAVALLLTTALFIATGHKLNVVTAIMPPVIFVVGFAYAIHVVSEVDEFRACAGGVPARLRAAVVSVAPPLVLTALTTGAGFLSLATSRIAAIREFGIWCTIGVLIALTTALFLVPVGLAMLGLPRAAPEPAARRALWAQRLARLATGHRTPILLGATALAVVAALGMARIQVDTDFVTNFREGSAVRRDFEALGEAFGGVVPISIELHAAGRDAFKDPANLARLRELQDWLAEQPEVAASASLDDLVALLARSLGRADETVPLRPAAIDQLLLVAPNETLSRFADGRFRDAVIRLRVASSSSADLLALAQKIENRVSALAGRFDVAVTGSALVVAHTVEEITRGQIASVASALLAIYVILAFLFQSPRVGVLALLPNALPVLVYFGTLGLVGVPLNATTALVACVVLGIAVDDTIHFLSRFNTAARAQADEAYGVREALRRVLRPVTVTTAALVLGFLVLIGSELRNQAEFGTLAAVTLALAWVLDLTFTPALCGRMRFVTLWEILSVDLGAEPHRTIPLFAGMSPRQARIAALLGSIREVEAGTPIVKRGEPGGSLMVVLDGEVSVWLPRDGDRQLLAQMGRGALLGESSLFGGTRTADVVAQTPVRVLRWTTECLDRIQARHPRVAAKLLRNLYEPMAGRFAQLADRLALEGLAPRAGLEPATNRLTADRSTS